MLKSESPATLIELRELENQAREGSAWVPRPLRCAPPPARTQTSLSALKYWGVFLTFASLGLTSAEVRLFKGKDLCLSGHPTISFTGEWHHGNRKISRRRVWILTSDQAASLQPLASRPPSAPLIPVGTEPERVHDACRWISYRAGLSRLLSYNQLLFGYKSISKGIGPKPLWF